jgi:hypothetical protein
MKWYWSFNVETLDDRVLVCVYGETELGHMKVLYFYNVYKIQEYMFNHDIMERYRKFEKWKQIW